MSLFGLSVWVFVVILFLSVKALCKDSFLRCYMNKVMITYNYLKFLLCLKYTGSNFCRMCCVTGSVEAALKQLMNTFSWLLLGRTMTSVFLQSFVRALNAFSVPPPPLFLALIDTAVCTDSITAQVSPTSISQRTYGVPGFPPSVAIREKRIKICCWQLISFFMCLEVGRDTAFNFSVLCFSFWV